MNRRYFWDPAKAQSNFDKHGIEFEIATVALDDPFAIIEQDRVEDGEIRWQTIGTTGWLTILLVCHTMADTDDGVEIVRIISARPATRSEKRRYENESR